jgi:predicted AAA+ superfamily ATPase
MEELSIWSNSKFYKQVLFYIYKNYSDKFHHFNYAESNLLRNYDMFERFDNRVKIFYPEDSDFDFDFKDETISFSLKTFYDKDTPKKILEPHGCSSVKENFIKKISLKASTKEILISFVDECNELSKKVHLDNEKSTKTTIKISFWKKDYWTTLSKTPKRPIDTLYLTEGLKEKMLGIIQDFYSEEASKDYINFGIPYKKVILLHGVPGSGKTSTIKAIASHFDCDIYIIPVSKELTDYGLIEAVSNIYFDEDENDRKKIIIMEDIDCIFTDRKRGDDENHISLQALLNCFDGLTSSQGTVLFITANNTTVFDKALLRSCRIDHSFFLDFVDKPQLSQMFTKMIPNQLIHLDRFWDIISIYKVTTAMLTDFIFNHRYSPNILKHIHYMKSIINNSDSLKQTNHSLYS